jgi:asparagine synthase (glutamine-hydrolysing)
VSGIAFVADPADAASAMARIASAAANTSFAISAPGPNARMAAWASGAADAAHRPLCVGGRFWVAVDGEIFDDHGAIAEPQAAIARLVERDDLPGLHRLNGSFAAIVYDPQHATLRLIADRLSTRPLYFWADGERIAAASRISHLLADDRVPRKVSEAGMLEVLAHQRTFAHHTIYNAIEGLSCGEVVTIAKGQVQRRQVSRPAWTGDLGDTNKIVDELAGRMQTAVRRRMPSGPVRHGLLLSGGLDSRMVLAAAEAERLHCFTVAPWDNAETETARDVAKAAGAPFSFLRSEPAAFHELLPDATRLVDGLMPAPLSLLGAYPAIKGEIDAAFSGHFLDIMFRGTYQPKAYLKLIRSRAAMPRHRKVADGSAETVAREHHIHTELAANEDVLAPRLRGARREAQIEGLRAALKLADYENPYDAFDVFCLHAQGRHHSNSDFLALNAWVEYRTAAMDRDVFDLYLRIPPHLRVGQVCALKAMTALSPKLFAIHDSGTGRPGTTMPRARVYFALRTAALKRLGIVRDRVPPKPFYTEGSWVNWTRWLREDSGIRARLTRLHAAPALMDLGILDGAGLRRMVDDHLEGRRFATKLLRQLLTFDSWFEQFPSNVGGGT